MLYLDIPTPEQIAKLADTRSDAAVTITQPGTTMRGTGMEADLAGKRFQLTSKVQTRYVPTRR